MVNTSSRWFEGGLTEILIAERSRADNKALISTFFVLDRGDMGQSYIADVNPGGLNGSKGFCWARALEHIIVEELSGGVER